MVSYFFISSNIHFTQCLVFKIVHYPILKQSSTLLCRCLLLILEKTIWWWMGNMNVELLIVVLFLLVNVKGEGAKTRPLEPLKCFKSK